jgi:hypothetical protein
MQIKSAAVVTLLVSVCTLSQLPAQDTGQSQDAFSDTDRATVVQKIRSAGARIQLKDDRPVRISYPDRNATDATLIDVIKLGRLTSLDLTGCAITDAGLQQLVRLTVTQLHLAETAVTDVGMQHVGRMDGLRLLNIEKTNVTDAGLALIVELPNLGDLWLRSTKVTNAGLKQLQSVQGLWRLSIGSPEITDDGLIHIAGLKNLSGLSVHDAPVSDFGVKQLGSLPRLRQLTLASTKVTDAGVNALKQLRPQLTVQVRTPPAAQPPVRRPAAATKSTPVKPAPAAPADSSAARPTQSPASETTRTKPRVPGALPPQKDVSSTAASSVSEQEAIRALQALGAEIKLENGTATSVVFQGDNSHVSDDDLVVVSALASLENLNLTRTRATDALLKQLTNLRNLKTLHLYRTDVTWIGITELEKAIPRIRVFATPPYDESPKWMTVVALLSIPAYLFAFASFLNVFIRVFRSVQSQRFMHSDTSAGRPQLNPQIRNAVCMAVMSVGVCFVASALPFVFEGTGKALKASSTQEWPTVDGQVVVSRIHKRVGFDTSNSSGDDTVYTPIIIYQYEVDGTEYTGHRIAYYRLGNQVAKFAHEQYPAGQKVSVSYDPSTPSDAVLEPGTGTENFTRIGLGVVISVVGLVLFFVARSRRIRVREYDAFASTDSSAWSSSTT